MQVVHNVYIEPAHIMRKRSVDQQLRIHMHYDRSVDALHDDTLKLVKVSQLTIISHMLEV